FLLILHFSIFLLSLRFFLFLFIFFCFLDFRYHEIGSEKISNNFGVISSFLEVWISLGGKLVGVICSHVCIFIDFLLFFECTFKYLIMQTREYIHGRNIL